MAGAACIGAGASSMGEATWPDYNENIHVIHNQGTDNERWYERVPVSMEGDMIQYQLKEIYKQQDGNGGGLIFLGLAIIIGDFIYDRIKGLQLVEEKRNWVRYKYGQQIKFTYDRNFYYSVSQNQLGIKFSFNLL